jgi:hypothetical protein
MVAIATEPLGAVVPPLPRRRRCRLDRRSPGDHLIVPEGGIRAFRNAGSEHASMLRMSVPGVPREGYFAAIVAVVREGRSLSAEGWTDLYARHDQYMV